MHCNRRNGKIVDVELGDEVVISGIAGKFPESDNIRQLQNNLFNKVDLGTEDNRRWRQGDVSFLILLPKDDAGYIEHCVN